MPWEQEALLYKTEGILLRHLTGKNKNRFAYHKLLGDIFSCENMKYMEAGVANVHNFTDSF